MSEEAVSGRSAGRSGLSRSWKKLTNTGHLRRQPLLQQLHPVQGLFLIEDFGVFIAVSEHHTRFDSDNRNSQSRQFFQIGGVFFWPTCEMPEEIP